MLREDGVLAHPLAFRILARLRHVDGAVKAGEYRFPAHQTSDQVLQRLVRGEQTARLGDDPRGLHRQADRRARWRERGLGDAAAFERIFLHDGGRGRRRADPLAGRLPVSRAPT